MIFVAHVEQVDLDAMEAAARAVMLGARLLTANYLRGFWGSNGVIFSRGAMVTAGISKVTGARPVVVGKPSRVAVDEVSARLGAPSEKLRGGGRRHQHGHRARPPGRVAHDPGAQRDERLGGHRGVPERQRPDEIVDGVEELLPWL